MTDFRALCAELTDKLSGYASANPHHDSDALIARARAALAEPEPKDDVALLREALAATAAQRRAEDDARAALEADGPAVPEGREPASVADEPSDEELLATLDKATAAFPPRHPEAEALNAVEYPLALELRKARAVIAADRARWGHQPAPPAAGAPGPSMEDVSPLIAWLTEQACQAADASQPTDAGMLTWAAQVIGERVNEDAPDPPAEGEGLPSDQEIADVFSQGCRDLSCSHEPPFLGGARAILARWGRHAPVPAPPAAGEAAEVAAWLRAYSDEEFGPLSDDPDARWLTRAADLIEQRQPAPPAEGEAVGPEWRPCVKLPITVHVREQRPGETHVSTREGITPVRPDDLIMRGVQGEEYPIGRELFEKTYRLGPAVPAPPAEGEVAELVEWLSDHAAHLRRMQEIGALSETELPERLDRAAELIQQRHPEPVPVAERLPVPEDCDAGGRCWAWDWMAEKWCLCDRTSACHGFDHWLPANALPLPTGEAK